MVLKEVVRENISNRYNFRKYTFPFTLCGWISGPGVEYSWTHRHYGLCDNYWITVIQTSEKLEIRRSWVNA